MPAALTATAVLTSVNLVSTALLCYPLWFSESYIPKVVAIVLGKTQAGYSRELALESLLNPAWRVLAWFVVLAVVTVITGNFAARVYLLLLKQMAVEDGAFGGQDPRGDNEKSIAKFFSDIGLAHWATARGASYWLVVLETAKTLSSDNPRVFADISQGEPFTLYRGQVNQVIASPSGEVHSMVVKLAERRIRTVYSSPEPEVERTIVQEGSWAVIGDSEAFYLEGSSINNISYRVYGHSGRYVKVEADHNGSWTYPEVLSGFHVMGSILPVDPFGPVTHVHVPYSQHGPDGEPSQGDPPTA